MHTVRFKISLTMFLLSVLAVGLVLIVYLPSMSALRTNEILYNMEATSQTKYLFDFLFDSVSKTEKLLSENASVMTALGAGESEVAFLRNDLSTTLKTCIYTNQAISAVHVIGEEPWQMFSSIPSVDEASLRQTCSALANDEGVLPKHALTGRKSIEYYPNMVQQVIQYITPIYNLKTSGRLGVIIVDINYDVLEETFLNSSKQSEIKTLVFRQDGEIILNYPYNIKLDSVLKDYPQLLREPECLIDGKVFDTDMLIVSDSIDNTDWRIVRMISTHRITKDTQAVMELVLKVELLVLLVSLMASYLLSRILTKPIVKLARGFHEAERGNMDARVDIRGKDELAVLGNAFNGMMSKLNAYFIRELELQKKKSDMELEVLETQINPHFLYNILDSIRWLAILQNVDNIASMTTALISLLRYNLSKDGPLVTLKKEVESVENYMQVQQYRYGTTLRLAKSLAPETLDLEMPRFILQPLVENCILHAYGEAEEIGRIEIDSKIVDGQLVIQVVDDGCGIAEDIDFDAVVDKGSRFKNIGVANIRERIRIYYGEGYGLKYISTPGQGTIAQLNLPVRSIQPF